MLFHNSADIFIILLISEKLLNPEVFWTHRNKQIFELKTVTKTSIIKSIYQALCVVHCGIYLVVFCEICLVAFKKLCYELINNKCTISCNS